MRFQKQTSVQPQLCVRASVHSHSDNTLFMGPCIRCENLDQRLQAVADLSAFCQYFRPDGEVCKVRPVRPGILPKANGMLGNPAGKQLFSIFNLWTPQERVLNRGNTESDEGRGVRPRKAKGRRVGAVQAQEVQRLRTQVRAAISNLLMSISLTMQKAYYVS